MDTARTYPATTAHRLAGDTSRTMPWHREWPDDTGPSWRALTEVGTEFLRQGVPVIWRRYRFRFGPDGDSHCGLIVAAGTDATMRDFVARALRNDKRNPNRGIVGVPVIEVDRPADPVWEWGGSLDDLVMRLGRTYWPGWQTEWRDGPGESRPPRGTVFKNFTIEAGGEEHFGHIKATLPYIAAAPTSTKVPKPRTT
jgi:hypothetical protein